MSEIFVIEEYAVALLLIATLVGIVARRLRMPNTVGLVMVGTARAADQSQPISHFCLKSFDAQENI